MLKYTGIFRIGDKVVHTYKTPLTEGVSRITEEDAEVVNVEEGGIRIRSKVDGAEVVVAASSLSFWTRPQPLRVSLPKAAPIVVAKKKAKA